MSKGGSAAKTGSTSGSSNALKVTYLKGDILLRAGVNQWIADLTNGPYSHAGICTNPAGFKAVDAHPVDAHRSAGHEVAKLPIADFFSKAHAPGGGDVYRYTGKKSEAEAAAKWAGVETGKPYTFDLFDPIMGSGAAVKDNNSLYCSEFVWRCYRTGAGVTLVNPKDFQNFKKDKATEDKSMKIMAGGAKDSGQAPWYAPEKVVVAWVKKRFAGHNGVFMAPIQLADSKLTKHIHAINGGAKMAGSKSSSK